MAVWKGNKISLALFGTSHAEKIGVTVCGLPQKTFSREKLSAFLARRRAKSAVFSTKRMETDQPEFTSGVEGDTITENEVTAVIYNKNVKSGDYAELYGKPRPSHADYVAYKKDGRLDFSGGGEFSGRLTAPLCVAGGIAKQILEEKGIRIYAYLSAVGGVKGTSYKHAVITEEMLQTLSEFPALSGEEKMIERITTAASCGDSVGGVVECMIFGLPVAIGAEPPCGLEGKIASLVFGIPAVKGVEFGSGFELAEMQGNTANDELFYDGEEVKTKTNRSGGINGGYTNGMPVTFSVAFRPTPSISKPQKTVDLVSKENVIISVLGRHDACIVPRAVPVVEAAAALAILDELLV